MNASNRVTQISQDIVDQASTWFVEFRLNEADAEARQRFIEWLRISPTHIRAYLEIAGTYAEMAPPGTRLELDVEPLIAAARADVNVVELKPRAEPRATSSVAPQPSTRRALLRGPFALAASLTLLIAGIGLWRLQVGETYTTQIAEQRSLILSDGSRIDLNARSQVRVRIDEHRRDIDLVQGQAYFQVAKDPNRPFIVRASDTRIRAVGTAFDVNRARSGTTVTVLEGRVAVQSSRVSVSDTAPEKRNGPQPKPAHDEILLTTGQQLQLSSHRSSKPRPANIAATTAWTQRKLVFDGTPLEDVIDEFNRYNARQLVIDDRDLDRFRVSGYYATPDPASLLAFLRSEPNIAVTEFDGEIHIARQ